MNTLCGTDTNVAASLLSQGELVAIPTETVYGLAANALNEEAVLEIFKTKERPIFNPLIVHVFDWDEAKKYVLDVPLEANVLAEHFWPGPLTLLLPKNNLIPDLVTAGSELVALRAPNHALTRLLLKQIDFPLAAPSANPSGEVSPTTAAHVLEGLNGKISYILSGGPCEVGLESTIVGWNNNGMPVIYRLGGISVEDIENVLGIKVEVSPSISDRPDTPGQLKSHYATQTPLYLGDITDLLAVHQGKQIAVIRFSDSSSLNGVAFQYVLSEHNSTEEAAKHLFETMRRADASGADVILCEPMPNVGLGPAINDRLKRAQFINKTTLPDTTQKGNVQ